MVRCEKCCSDRASGFHLTEGKCDKEFLSHAIPAPAPRCSRGVPERRTRLLLADPLACNSRNARPGEITYESSGPAPAPASLAMHGDALTGQTLLHLLTGDYLGALSVLFVSVPDPMLLTVARAPNLHPGIHAHGTPAQLRLPSDASSFVTLFLTGHGGDEFLKIHDQADFTTADLGAALRRMHALQRSVVGDHAMEGMPQWSVQNCILNIRGRESLTAKAPWQRRVGSIFTLGSIAPSRYRHLLLLVDTCQAATLCKGLQAPNVTCISSSVLGGKE